MIERSKQTRKEFRRLLIKAYAKELDQHLSGLAKKFDDWKNKKIDCWDLSDHIHEFHNGISRELFDKYNPRARGVDDLFLIAGAVANDLILLDEIPEEAIEKVKGMIEAFFEKEPNIPIGRKK